MILSINLNEEFLPIPNGLTLNKVYSNLSMTHIAPAGMDFLPPGYPFEALRCGSDNFQEFVVDLKRGDS